MQSATLINSNQNTAFLPDLSSDKIKQLQKSPWQSTHLNSNRDGTSSSDMISNWVVTKGGSWFDAAIYSRSAARKKRLFDEMDTNLGFRVVREL